MLEMFTLKQQLETVRQELGHALYQHDAACRVIARLIKERDDARNALADAKPAAPQPLAVAAPAPAAMDVDSGVMASGMTPDILAKFAATSKELSKGRKKRQPPAEQASAEDLAAYGEATSKSLHKAGRACVDLHTSEPVLASGGADGKVVIFDAANGKVKATLKGHTQGITRVRLHPTKPVAISCSLDGTARTWDTSGKPQHTIAAHTAEVTDCSLHATGDYFVTVSADKSWMLTDLERGACVLSVKDASLGYNCTGFHPDGLILGTGTGKVVRIWDVKSQNNVASFEGHEGTVACLSFSENGYYLATGADDATIKLWDLRKLKNFHTISTGGAVSALHFDYSAQFLSVGSTDVIIYETKTWSTVATYGGNKAAVSGVSFGPGATKLASASVDGVVKVYGK